MAAAKAAAAHAAIPLQLGPSTTVAPALPRRDSGKPALARPTSVSLPRRRLVFALGVNGKKKMRDDDRSVPRVILCKDGFGCLF